MIDPDRELSPEDWLELALEMRRRLLAELLERYPPRLLEVDHDGLS